MDSKIILDNIEFWKKINPELDFKNYISFSSKKDIYSKFIKEFPELKKENVKLIIQYIKKYKKSIEVIEIFDKYLTEENLFKIVECLEIHKQKIIEVIEIDNSFLEKKRIYLGLIWFGLGFYISYFIIKILNYEKYFHFFCLEQVSINKYIIFLTASFIFYDSIFDDNTKDIKARKICIDYTKYFLKFLIDNTPVNDTIQDIMDRYLIEKKINFNILDQESKNVIEKSNKILNLLLDETKKNKNLKKLESIYELFNAEIITSKIQHNEKEINEENVLKCTIFKSCKSIIAIMQCITGDLDFNMDINLNNKIHIFAFLTQLLDDFNDIAIDNKENNFTIFTIKKNNDIEINIKKLFNYIYHLKKMLEKDFFDRDLIDINFYINLSIFNYSLSKYENKELISKLYDFMPYKVNDIDYLRDNKNNFINNYSFNENLVNLIKK